MPFLNIAVTYTGLGSNTGLHGERPVTILVRTASYNKPTTNNKYVNNTHINNTYMGCPESFRTFKIARHFVDLAGRGKCYSLVMSLTNCVAKTALPYLDYSLCCASLCDHMFGASGDSLETRK